MLFSGTANRELAEEDFRLLRPNLLIFSKGLPRFFPGLGRD